MATRTPAKRESAGKPAKKPVAKAALAKPKAATAQKMAAAKKTPAKRPAARKAPQPQDAVAMLRADHALVASLFADYEKSRSQSRKKALVARICTELGVHAQVEEEIFYPAVKQALKDKELVPEATVEHATLKDLMAQVEGKEPDGEMFDAKIKVLSEYVKHHVKEEHTEMFPKAKGTKLDMKALGAQMAARKEELKPAKAAAAQVPGLLAQLSGRLAMG